MQHNTIINTMMRKLGIFVFVYLLLAGDFLLISCVDIKDAPTLGSKYSPRVLTRGINAGGFQYSAHQSHTVLFYDADSEEMYVGGTNFVLKLDVDDFHVLENFSLNTTGQQQCEEGPCKNVITVIEKFQDSMFVCGTNGQKPQCWKLFPSVDTQPPDIIESIEGMGITPFTHTQNSLSLIVEGDLYTAAPLRTDGSMLQFRRNAGSRSNVWMYDKWVSEPTFISASWVKRKEDPDNEKIYIFFREKNRDNNPEADPWISRVARICKVDEGGPKRFFQNMWTSFLKARLVCGFPDESLYFNRLQDIYVMEAEDWRDTRVYALFSSSWNSTAVCIYTVRTIEELFENSTFKGYDNDIPKPRPGTCQKDSRSLPRTMVNIVKDHPEMTDWVHSIHPAAPFYISTYNYTKIVVDQVQAADQRMYNVLLLSTESAKIHKVLEAGSKPFIISETQLFSHSTLQSIKLDSKKKKLVVGFSEKISRVDLQRCQDYNESCADCVMARDPYCAWTEFGCTPNVSGGIQDILTGDRNVCTSVKGIRTKRETLVDSALHYVPLGVPFFLSCPIDSYHAEYTWRHGDETSPCLQMQADCLHLIPSMAPEDYGTYECVSKEKDYVKVVKSYQVEEQKIPNMRTEGDGNPYQRNGASIVVPQICGILGVGVAVMGIFR